MNNLISYKFAWMNYRFFCYFVISTFAFLLCIFKPENFDNDYQNYLELYSLSINASFDDANIFSLYLLTSLFSHIVGVGLNGVFFLYAGVGFALKSIIIYLNKRDIFLILLLYILTFYPMHELTQIRVSLGIAVFMLFHYISSSTKKSCVYWIGIFLSSIIHLSCFVLIFSKLVKTIVIKLKILRIIVVIASFPISLLLSSSQLKNYFLYIVKDLLGTFEWLKVSTYIDLMEQGKHVNINPFNVFYLFYYFLAVILVFNFEKIRKKCNEFEILLVTNFLFGLVFFYLFVFFPVVSYRISELLMVGLPFVLSIICNLFVQKMFSRLLLMLLVMLIFLVNIFYNKLLNFDAIF